MSRRSAVLAVLLFGLCALFIGGAFFTYAGRGGWPAVTAVVLQLVAGVAAFLAGVRQFRRTSVGTA